MIDSVIGIRSASTVRLLVRPFGPTKRYADKPRQKWHASVNVGIKSKKSTHIVHLVRLSNVNGTLVLSRHRVITWLCDHSLRLSGLRRRCWLTLLLQFHLSEQLSYHLSLDFKPQGQSKIDVRTVGQFIEEQKCLENFSNLGLTRISH